MELKSYREVLAIANPRTGGREREREMAKKMMLIQMKMVPKTFFVSRAHNFLSLMSCHVQYTSKLVYNEYQNPFEEKS